MEKTKQMMIFMIGIDLFVEVNDCPLSETTHMFNWYMWSLLLYCSSLTGDL